MVKKIFKPKKSKIKKQAEKLPSRITNDTIAEHREQVLADGRKLKYPMQYTRQKLIKNTVIISSVVLVGMAVLVWAQLYVWRDTGDLAYRITRTIPVPVARIDGEYVRYSDYLLYHRSTLAGLSAHLKDNSSIDGDRLKFQQKRAMDRALEDAYAKKIAREKGIRVSSKEIEDLMNQPRKENGMSDAAYAAAVSESLHWTMGEMRQATKSAIVRREAAFAIDDKAKKQVKRIEELLSKGKGLEEISKSLGDRSVEFQPKITVPSNNSDGGLTVAALKVDVGKISKAVKTTAGDGYYFIRRHSDDGESVSYSYLRVPLTEFKDNFVKLRDKKTKIFIDI